MPIAIPPSAPPALHAPEARPAFQAQHRSLSYTQHLEASPVDVMPFLTPTGERAWAEDWDPTVLHPQAGPEGEGTVFLTAGPAHPSTWWVCTEFSVPSAGAPARVTYAHFTPGRDVTTIHITLEAEGPDRTLARIRYSWTGLSAQGNAFVAHHDAAHFEADMKEWEHTLNAALRHGKGGRRTKPSDPENSR
ncbi:hypothetical protein GETHLI_22020 [Geothrix limicola]|uniref:Activator of Hsp90 ATPase 1 family protein n=1 Tax=Geothrix limicola TaxID=2927978 RepID=A0ABQ5QHQ7_9BACT|nr:hypothetical protein [Geothrix limicola]GLH73700.1 hypothetical protein GETHLI_22020 [Geothrix limicola]